MRDRQPLMVLCEDCAYWLPLPDQSLQRDADGEAILVGECRADTPKAAMRVKPIQDPSQTVVRRGEGPRMVEQHIKNSFFPPMQAHNGCHSGYSLSDPLTPEEEQAKLDEVREARIQFMRGEFPGGDNDPAKYEDSAESGEAKGDGLMRMD